jgi:hypothetical protein
MPPAQPIQPVQQPQVPNTLDFTQQQPTPTAPVYTPPVQPTVDPNVAQLQTDISEIKNALGALVPQQQQPQTPEAQESEKTYDQWGAVFKDTAKQAQDIVNKALEDRAKVDEEARKAAAQQEQQNQQMIDSTVNQLRAANYLPPVLNQFDANDPGKQAENELLGYAISLGSTDLVRTAQELKFRHDAGFKYDYQTKQFVQVNGPSAQDPNSMMFGNLPQTPDAQAPQQNPFGMQPQMPQTQQPYGPQNPYMQPPQQYPAGFNAPVSSGASYQGMQGQVPPLKAIRSNSYDALVDQFNRTQ